jgi:hypothetical protein
VESLARPNPENGEDWMRMVTCSQCKEYHSASGRREVDDASE